MKMCPPCFAYAKTTYVGIDDKEVPNEDDCDVHPRLDNPRLIRCLGTITYWGQQPEGFSDRRAPTPLSRGNGWVARRSAMCILFDYEAPFIDLMIQEGLLDHSTVDTRLTLVMPESIRTTAKGEAHLSDWANAHADHPKLGRLARNILDDVLHIRGVLDAR